MKKLSGLLAVLALFLFASISYSQTNYVKRINCGDSNSTTHAGETYDADNQIGYTYTGDNLTTSGHSGFTLDTNPGEIFALTKYTTGASMQYYFPVQDGDYNVILHWAEPFHGPGLSGQPADYRQFDVQINGGSLEEDNLKVFVEAGINTPLVRTYSVTAFGGNGVTIEFIDQNENDPIISAIEVLGVATTDTTPPTTPGPLAASAITTNSAQLNWTASTDNVGVSHYDVFQNGIKQNTSNITQNSYVLTGLTPNSTYTYSVRAYDAANNMNETTLPSFTTAVVSGSPGYDPNFELRLNAGGTSVTADGDTFLDDQYFVGGSITSTPSTILNAPHDRERYVTSGNMSYNIPVVDGLYKVRLSFAELYWNEANKRVIDVDIEGGLKLDDFDVFVEAGGKEVLAQRSFDIQVSDGELNIDFTRSLPTSSHHPQVTAIEVLGSNFIDSTPPPTGGGTDTGLWSSNGTGIFNTLNVGIGTTPQSNYRLAVDGKIHTKEVKVDLNGWADYVFLDNYEIPTLEEVELHIQQKGHLINIPSAEEVEANGIELGEMNKLLLEKIEELTLYVISLQKEIDSLKKSN